MTATLISIVVLALVVWFVFWLVDTIGIGEPFNKIIKVVVAVLAIVKVLGYLL